VVVGQIAPGSIPHSCKYSGDKVQYQPCYFKECNSSIASCSTTVIHRERERERKREKKQKKMGQYLNIDIPISEKFIASVYASENTEQPSRKLQLRYLLTDITAFFASFPVYDKNDLPLSKSLLNTSKYDKPLRHVICGP
jgi:hypothetical protein